MSQYIELSLPSSGLPAITLRGKAPVALRSQSGTYTVTGSNTSNFPITSNNANKRFEWRCSSSETIETVALLQELFYLQEQGELGNILLEDRMDPVNQSWLEGWGNRVLVGDPFTNGPISKYNFRTYVVITLPTTEPYEERRGPGADGNQYTRVDFTAYELPG